jgi:aspartate 1-decarboxylase
MFRTMFKSKLHRVTLTGVKLQYAGSIAIDENLMEAADLLPSEQVDVLNCNNGSRLTTYVLKGRRGSGVIELRGPAARLGHPGDPLVIVSYCLLPDEQARAHKPTIVRVDAKNRPLR